MTHITIINIKIMTLPQNDSSDVATVLARFSVNELSELLVVLGSNVGLASDFSRISIFSFNSIETVLMRNSQCGVA